jgi:enoyl-CoA hydratase/carnithine racemase
MLFTAEPISAQRALDYGLVHEVVRLDELDQAAEALARRLLELPAEAVRAAKRALVEGAGLPLPVALQLEAHLRQQLARALSR